MSLTFLTRPAARRHRQAQGHHDYDLSQFGMVATAARTLPDHARDEFFRRVADQLRALRRPEDDDVRRAAREVSAAIRSRAGEKAA
jgi:hypothetical protein